LSSQMKIPAKKRFGQHFLRDTGIIDKIVRLINPVPDDLILEIGAGDGALSTRLAPRVSRLLAVEVDRDCLDPLHTALAGAESAVIIGQDILSLDLADLLLNFGRPNQRIRIVGNLPYNISSVIISKLLHSTLAISDMTFMVQLEVAQRLIASPGTKEYGFFSVECRHLSAVRLAFKVPAACFVPRPQVVSAMVIMEPLNAPRDPVVEDHILTLTKAAFAYRRKTLANSLAQDDNLALIAEELLREAGIDGSIRAEQLSVQEYEHLAQVRKRLGECPRTVKQSG
jgi:16S rRNA (adenine1518-N6/adenine1519-N6)-dimethyltransferase